MALATTLARSVRQCPRVLTRCLGFTTAAQDESNPGQVATRTEGKPPRHAPPTPLPAPTLIDLPFRRMSDMMSQMQREMDQMLGSFGALNPYALMDTLGRDLLPPAPLATRRLVPLEVQEDDKAYSVRAEMPGFTKDDIKVTLDPQSGTLTLTGQKSTGSSSEEEAGKQGGGYRSSMYFQRTITLPQNVDLDKPITGKTEHGVLTLVLPKGPHKSHVKEIPVE